MGPPSAASKVGPSHRDGRVGLSILHHSTLFPTLESLCMRVSYVKMGGNVLLGILDLTRTVRRSVPTFFNPFLALKQ